MKMKKLYLILGAIVILTTMVAASSYYYFATDEFGGSGLEVQEFSDPMGIIETLLYEEMLTRQSNRLSGEITTGFAEDGNDLYEVGDLNFYGKMNFKDGSVVEYEIADFQVLQTDVQEDVSFAVGDAMFTYEATVKIKETLPVEVIVEVIEDEGYNEQIVIIDGETIDAEFIGDNRFRHEREVIWNE